MPISFLKKKISVRLSLFSIGILIFFASLSSLLILFVEYEQEKKRLINDTQQLIDTITPQLAKSLWDFDEKSKNTLLTSLNNSEIITSLSILNTTDDITYDDKNQLLVEIKYSGETLGSLLVNYNFSLVTTNVINNVKLISYVFIPTLLLMGLMLYLLVDRLIIKNISKISQFAMQSNPEYLDQFTPLKLKRKNYQDEINQLVNAINHGKQDAIELLSARKEHNDYIEHQLNFDILTNLPNSRNLDNHLEEEIKNHNPRKGSLALFLINLDDFKSINDNVGHTTGDEVLKISALRIKSVIDRYKGYISRLGGDEFIACVHVVNQDIIEIIAQELIATFSGKIHYRDFYHRLGCSIGITLYPDHQANNAQKLIANADIAKSRAKQLGKNTHFVFDKDMMNQIIMEEKIKNKIALALEQEKFTIHYQPLINILDNKIVGFEALIRWHDEEIGYIRPDIFIEIAERMGIMFYIDSWVFQNAVKQVSLWREHFKEDFILSVNFSPTNFYHTNFKKHISQKWFHTDNLDWVELEITERLILNNDTTVIDGLNFIKSHGIRFSIDDFGIGYSSLGYISKFSQYLSKIKIDRMFIQNITTTDYDITFVRSIKLLADNLKLDLLAEGVETIEQADKLKAVNCQYVQGYYYSKPLTPEAIENFILGWKSKTAMVNNDSGMSYSHH